MLKQFSIYSFIRLGILTYSLGFPCLHAQDFRSRSYKYPIGKVISIEGTVIALANFERTLQYLDRGDLISNKLRIETRSNAKATIKIGERGFVTLGPNTRVSILFQQNQSKTLIHILKGSLRYEYRAPSDPTVFIAGRSQANYYSAHSFDAVIHNQRFYFRKNGKGRIYKYSPINVGEKDPLEIGTKDLELLTQNLDASTPTYRLKKAQKMPIKSPIKESKANGPELSDAASIFGDSILNTTSPTNTDNIFSSISDNNKNQASSIFGEETQTKNKHERRKVKENIGVQLTKDLPSLPKVDIRAEDDEIGPFDITLYTKSTLYTEKPRTDLGNVDQSSFHQDVRVSIGNKLNLSSSESLTFNGWIEGSNRKHIYNKVGKTLNVQSSMRNNININELYYTQSTKNYDIQLGKKVVKVGKGIIYSPTDSISATDVTVPTTPLFIGNVIASLDYYIKNWTLTTIYFPIIVPNKRPTQNSRWTTLYSNINYDLKQEFPKGFSLKSSQIFFKLEGTAWGTDWLFSFFNGPNSNPVIRNDISVIDNVPHFTLVQEYVPITFYSMGFSTTFKGLELHGEILNQNAQGGKDDSFTAFMIGGRYTLDTVPKVFGLNTIDMIIEHGQENTRSYQKRPFYARSSIGSRLYQNSWLGTIIFNINDEFSFNYDFHYDQKHNGKAVIYSFNYSAGSSQWRIRMENFDGQQASNFGKWRNNDNYSLEYNYKF